jgi:hypothetical protein
MAKRRTLAAPVALALCALALSGGGTFAAAGRASAPARIPISFADPAFLSLWMRTDSVVDNGAVKRSYYWGPLPGFTTQEDYAEGPNGKHLVQYFDKSRMEVNNPNGDKTNPFYVTNGLLTRELISGMMQVGDTAFVPRYPAEIVIAGDTDDTAAGTPTYASFRAAMYSYGETGRVGQTIIDTINRAGLTGTDPRYSNYGVKYAYYEPATKHNIPDKFWTFMNASGPVVVGGKTVNARLSDPYFYATGYPIAEAFWANVKIAGASNLAVLIQPYERRVLTYVPTAPEGFKVQMGNIGQHYYDWRYKEAGRPVPPPVRCDQVPIRGFGTVWANNPDVQQRLGCTYQPERPATVAHQYFEHGAMIDVIQQYNPYGGSYKLIYVLFEDGTVQRFQDTYVDGTPEPPLNPPPGRLAPVRGFGKVWREGTGARVRERLGWATAPETVAVANFPPFPGPVPTAAPDPSATPIPPGQGGAVQEFQRGMMVYTGPVNKKIYVFYSDQGYGAYDITRWSVYDDTFEGP